MSVPQPTSNDTSHTQHWPLLSPIASAGADLAPGDHTFLHDEQFLQMAVSLWYTFNDANFLSLDRLPMFHYKLYSNC